MRDIQNTPNQMPEDNGSISEQFLGELCNISWDLSPDYTQIFIDDLTNGALSGIPLVKTIVGVVKGGIAFSQFWFAKKILNFIQQFNKAKLPPEKIEKFRAELADDKNLGKKIAEKLMVFIDRNIELQQTQIIANLFSAHINGDLTWEEFENIVITLDHLNPKAYSAFFDLEKIGFQITADNLKEIGDRNFEMESLITSSGFAIKLSPFFSGFGLTDDGLKLFNFGIKPLNN